jgi:hypothetical protein
MDINRFLPDPSVLPHHGILLAVEYPTTETYTTVKVVYSGPLRNLDESLLERAKITLVHPGTLAALKAKLDEIGAGTPIPVTIECPHCDGSGTRRIITGISNPLAADETCGECAGSGTIVNPDYG